MRTGSPVAVAIADELPLPGQIMWLPCELIPGESYRLRALVEGGPDTADNGAVVRFDMLGGAVGTGLSVSQKTGAHITLRTGAGLHRTDRVFTVGRSVPRIGLNALADRGPTRIRTLVVERVPPAARPVDIFFSVDVEASASRATGDPIDQLVWGRIGGQEYGIARICRVLEEHGLVGNFMVDFVTCARRGDGVLQEIIDYLGGRGHEVHMHLHPETLAEYRVNGNDVHLDRAPYDMSRSLLELALTPYTRFVGRKPYVFRSAGYRINDHLVRAAGDLGFGAMTNLKPNTLIDIAIGGDEVPYREPFVWENGVREIPVDVSSPEVGGFRNYLTKYHDAIARKPTRPTFNVVMHSWSLMRRNDNGQHDTHAPEYEQRLHEMCEHAATQGRVRGYAEYLESLPTQLPLRRMSQVRVYGQPRRSGVGTCNICHSAVEPSDLSDDDCPTCGFGVTHRQLRFALDEYADVVAGAAVLSVGLTLAEREALLGQADSTVVRESAPGPGSDAANASAADGSCDCAVWLGAPDQGDGARIVAEVARLLTPGGVLVRPDATAGHDADAPPPGYAALRARTVIAALPRTLFAAPMPTIDPVTTQAGWVYFIYKRGGTVRPSQAWRSWPRAVGSRFGHLASLARPRVRWLMTRPSGLVRALARAVRRLPIAPPHGATPSHRGGSSGTGRTGTDGPTSPDGPT
jgi:hypothetical protein